MDEMIIIMHRNYLDVIYLKSKILSKKTVN